MANGRLAQSRVGVLGSGEVGRRLAAGFCSRGHDVMIGSRDPGKPELREWLAGDGAGVKAGTFEQAAAHGDLLVLAVLGNAAEEAIADAGPENFSGKVVIDAMNPLDFSGGFPPRLSITGGDSLGERVQRALPEAKVVKAFNTIGNPYFVDPRFSESQPTMLIAGDDEGAKRTVGDVLADFGWSDVVDIGGIEGSRELEAICIVWVKIGGAGVILCPSPAVGDQAKAPPGRCGGSRLPGWVTFRNDGPGRPWTGPWTGSPGIPVQPVPSVRFPVLSVQLMRTVDVAVVMDGEGLQMNIRRS